jgi:4-hydroxy-3-methylbut-2-enyl diphosphate reductase
MKINVDESAGFCWGVVRAINIAEQELEKSSRVYSLGDVIHNSAEVDRLKKKGLVSIRHDELKNIEDGAKVLIRAHGEPPSTYRLIGECGVELIDATCPVVGKVQERIKKFYDQGYQIVIFGKKDHAEVIGLRGVCNDEAIVIKSLEEALRLDLSRKTVFFSQTTMDKPTFHQIKEALQEKVRDLVVGTMEEEALEFHAKDTICGQASGRDKKLKAFARANNVVVFVAGGNSSNGKVLFEIARSSNPRTYFVEDESGLRREWFEGVESVGVTGATSTPRWLMERVKDEIQEVVPGQGDFSINRP